MGLPRSVAHACGARHHLCIAFLTSVALLCFGVGGWQLAESHCCAVNVVHRDCCVVHPDCQELESTLSAQQTFLRWGRVQILRCSLDTRLRPLTDRGLLCACRMTETRRLRQLFEQMDRRRAGELDLDAFKDFLARQFPAALPKAAMIFHAMTGQCASASLGGGLATLTFVEVCTQSNHGCFCSSSVQRQGQNAACRSGPDHTAL